MAKWLEERIHHRFNLQSFQSSGNFVHLPRCCISLSFTIYTHVILVVVPILVLTLGTKCKCLPSYRFYGILPLSFTNHDPIPNDSNELRILWHTDVTATAPGPAVVSLT